LIYTSGTTGLPKAASISHRRILNWGGWFAGLTDANPDDRLYNCLPVYHGAGLDSTETFKQKKQLLMREGFDPSVVGEPLCFQGSEIRRISRARCCRFRRNRRRHGPLLNFCENFRCCSNLYGWACTVFTKQTKRAALRPS
jgi:hypothetical protein